MVYPDSESPTVDPLDVQNDYLGIIVLGMEERSGNVQVYIASVFILEPDRIVRLSLNCDFSNVVAFGHNELRRPKAANSLAVTSKCCGLWPQ